MKNLILVVLALALTTPAYANGRSEHHDAYISRDGGTRYYNNRPLCGSNGERAVAAVAEMVSAFIAVTQEPTPIYQVPAIIVPRYGQPYTGYFGSNYVATYLDATNGLLAVRGNIQILLPNDGQVRTVEQKGDVIIITNLTTKEVMTIKVQ